MKKQHVSFYGRFLGGCLAVFALSGCGTTTGNPLITLKFGGFIARNGSLMEWLIPSAYAALSNTSICIKRLRFKTENINTVNPTADPDNMDFQPGEILLNSGTGASLGTVRVLANTYQRVEFDLDPGATGCTTGTSVTMTNSNGSYTSTDGITVKFEGSFAAVYDGQVLTLGLQGIVNGLNTVTGPNGPNPNIKTTLESASVSGSL